MFTGKNVLCVYRTGKLEDIGLDLGIEDYFAWPALFQTASGVAYVLVEDASTGKSWLYRWKNGEMAKFRLLPEETREYVPVDYFLEDRNPTKLYVLYSLRDGRSRILEIPLPNE
ncbi:MAG: hypothetical protein IBX64_13545 [Actinobacteria bacterium]|nr:hypothetical protein [Actinomycetota bacterium]